MFTRRNFGFALVLLAAVSVFADAAETTLTVINVEKMHCAGCAKKLAEGVGAVPGVARVEAVVKTKKLVVTPKDNVQLSPRALWEAVEKADDVPTKLVSPNGVFTKKPQS